MYPTKHPSFRVVGSAFAVAALALGLAAEPAAAQGNQAEAEITANLNARSGPGTSNPSQFVVPQGTTVTIIQCNEPVTWCQFQYGNRTAWGSANYMRSTQLQRPIGQVAAQLGLAIIGQFLQQFLPPQPQLQPPAPPPSQPRRPGPNEVCFYADYNFGGQSFCATVGQSNASLSSVWNDRISSIAVGANASVQVCGDYSFGGWCQAYSDNISQLTGYRNDAISSYRTYSAGYPSPNPGPQYPPSAQQVCFYDGPYYSGSGFCLGPNQNYPQMPQGWNNRVSSIRVDPGMTVQVCGSTNYAGWCQQYTSSVPVLDGYADDEISSFRTWSSSYGYY